MKRLLILTLGAGLAAGACGATTDAADTLLPSERAFASTTQTAPGYREMTIFTGTTLQLALTNSVASDTSAVEDSVIAFRFTSLHAGDARYDPQAAPLSRLADATQGEDATKIGIGADVTTRLTAPLTVRVKGLSRCA
jgi:hypothetical protein